MADNGNYPKGKMRWKCLLGSRFSTSNAIGAPDDTLQNQMWVYADIIPLTGYQLMRNVQLDNGVTHEAVINYKDNIDATFVLYRKSLSNNGAIMWEVWRIIDIFPMNGRKRYLKLSMALESTITGEAK